jgi:hypothetical protein
MMELKKQNYETDRRMAFIGRTREKEESCSKKFIFKLL